MPQAISSALSILCVFSSLSQGAQTSPDTEHGLRVLRGTICRRSDNKVACVDVAVNGTGPGWLVTYEKPSLASDSRTTVQVRSIESETTLRHLLDRFRMAIAARTRDIFDDARRRRVTVVIDGIAVYTFTVSTGGGQVLQGEFQSRSAGASCRPEQGELECLFKDLVSDVSSK